MKRGYLLGAFVLLFGILLMNFASAYFYFPDARSLTQSVIDAYVDVGEPILQALFGGYGGWSGFLLFERFLLFILLLSLIYVVLGRVEIFEEQKAVRWVIAIIVPLIGMRFVDYEWLSAVLLQYQVLAIAMTAILPFFIYFFFLYSMALDYPIPRKLGWIFFGVVYIGLWSTTMSESASQIYFWTIAAVVVCLIFDKKIENYLRFRNLTKQDVTAKHKEMARINDEIQTLEKQIRSGSIDPKYGRKAIHDLTKQKNWLLKNL